MEKASHYERRLRQRGIPLESKEMCMSYGRIIYQGKGRRVYFIGKNEVNKYGRLGIDLSLYLNIAYIEASDGGDVTIIRCDNFSRLKKTNFKSLRVTGMKG